MEKCHLTIRCQSQIDNMEYMIDFSEDNTIAKPYFIRKDSVEHTIQSRWATPCRVILKPIETKLKNMKYYNAYYHPLTYQLSKNPEFKKLIIENAIESLTCNGSPIPTNNYEIVTNIENDLVKIDKPTRPRYEISMFSSQSFQQTFVQLIIWLPLIISSNSIVIETSESSIYLQTEKPHKYELLVPWPHQISYPEICFCNFLPRQKSVVLVAEYHQKSLLEEVPLSPILLIEPSSPLSDSSSDKENFSPPPGLSPALAKSSSQNGYEWPPIVDQGHKIMSEITLSNGNEIAELDAVSMTTEIDGEWTASHSNIGKKKQTKNCKKGRIVRFDSFNSCLEFVAETPVLEIVEDKCSRKVPMKTHDGCTAKKFNYQLNNKSNKNNREKSKNSARSKRNNNKKRS